MIIKQLPSAAAWFALCLGVGGCSSSDVIPVQGEVRVRGGTIPAGATIVFSHDATQRSSSGTVQSDGQFQLTTDKPNDGAPVGPHRVTVHNPSAADSSQGEPPRTFHAKYENPSTSGLTANVQPGQAVVKFELDPP
jgi:hypothetical protein